MSDQGVLQAFRTLSTWSRGDQRAPHKPPLVLLALAHWQRGCHGPLLFADIDPELMAQLKEFDPSRQSFHPEYPFWRLRNDGVWQVTSEQPMKPRASNNDVLKSELIAHNATGEFTTDVKAALEQTRRS